MTELPPSVKEFSQYMLVVKGRSPRTVEQYEIDLMLFFKFMKCKRQDLPTFGEAFDELVISDLDYDFAAGVTRSDILEFLTFAARGRENSARTRARKLSALKSYYKYYCVAMMRFPNNPAESIDSPKIPATLPRHLTVDESVELLSTVNEEEEKRFRERNFCILTLFLNCGLRLSELVSLNLESFSKDLSTVTVMGKGAKERMLYLNDACQSSLKAYLAVRDKAPDPKSRNALFLSSRKKRLGKEMVQTIVKDSLAEAGLDGRGLSTHKLRHTAATLMYQTGKVDIRVLKDILGHEQLTTTQIYTHVSDSAMEKAMFRNPLSEVTEKKLRKRRQITASEDEENEESAGDPDKNDPDA